MKLLTETLKLHEAKRELRIALNLMVQAENWNAPYPVLESYRARVEQATAELDRLAGMFVL